MLFKSIRRVCVGLCLWLFFCVIPMEVGWSHSARVSPSSPYYPSSPKNATVEVSFATSSQWFPSLVSSLSSAALPSSSSIIHLSVTQEHRLWRQVPELLCECVEVCSGNQNLWNVTWGLRAGDSKPNNDTPPQRRREGGKRHR